ncbi:uncharacterized protein BJ212DRAFT_1301637 [Suillus subaureus]|uniref:CHAT domain-containing protein n=1 Tax=Suillus subaureus TaxID=48587 RepID=A0A9P7E6N7_9AGAM|nr:uncharacterized protein BJ212DRAFT_1301637 [Suillus subaureus]KAG1812103.1 hypothetical protein BJ212DRAFT_1301637 [Suillus subaureus]
MKFSGFRSVIGSIWSVDDEVVQEVASAFYGNLVDGSGRLDCTRAAMALNKAVKKLRRNNIPLEQQIVFVHIGRVSDFRKIKRALSGESYGRMEFVRHREYGNVRQEHRRGGAEQTRLRYSSSIWSKGINKCAGWYGYSGRWLLSFSHTLKVIAALQVQQRCIPSEAVPPVMFLFVVVGSQLRMSRRRQYDNSSAAHLLMCTSPVVLLLSSPRNYESVYDRAGDTALTRRG